MILTIAREVLMKLINSRQDIKMVDVQDCECYQLEHIKGAISIPFEKIDDLAESKLKKRDFIIIYSKNIFCCKSMAAALKLELMGYDNIYVYREGIEDYKNHYLPLEVIFLPDTTSRIYQD